MDSYFKNRIFKGIVKWIVCLCKGIVKWIVTSKIEFLRG